MIQEKKGIAADRAKLIFGSRYLEDGHTLSGCSIQDGAILNLGRMEIHVPLPHQFQSLLIKINKDSLLDFHTSLHFCPEDN